MLIIVIVRIAVLISHHIASALLQTLFFRPMTLVPRHAMLLDNYTPRASRLRVGHPGSSTGVKAIAKKTIAIINGVNMCQKMRLMSAL